MLQEDRGYSVVALSPESNSLDPAFNSKYVTVALARAELEGLRVASQSLGEDPASSPTCSCDEPNAYVLFTTHLRMESPVSCLDCFRPVPLYRLEAMESGEFHELISWQSDYQACDSLQMNCRVLERAATREISTVSSSLAKLGRAHCEILAASSKRPFYYYLYRGHGRSHKTEIMRRCPGCGEPWHLASRLHSLFDFKCDRCNLVSNVAFDLGS